MNAPSPELVAFLRQAGLAAPGEQGSWTPLAGGVSSDIWHVSLRSGAVCVKRARAQLKVAAEWKAPVERNVFEWEYMQVADRIVPGHVPRPIARDPALGLFAMEWLAPHDHRLWKNELLAGRVDPAVGTAVGSLIGRIHSATAQDASIAARFATDDNFYALRIEPYMVATAAKHPDLKDRIDAVARRTMNTKLALVHGDVSPKNILIGSRGPVLLDAECAWFGDPAFDLAFCLNHLIIKARVITEAGVRISEAGVRISDTFDALLAAYRTVIDWESPDEFETRVAALLPVLALARVDGKSPLEYLRESDRASLRRVARDAVACDDRRLAEVKEILLR